MLRKRLNALKREQFPWMLEVSKCAAQEAIINLGVSFSNFFRDCKKPKAQRRFHYPKPKKKGVHDSFCAANEVGTFRCDGKRVKLPVVGWVRMREALRFEGIAKYVTVARVKAIGGWLRFWSKRRNRKSSISLVLPWVSISA